MKRITAILLLCALLIPSAAAAQDFTTSPWAVESMEWAITNSLLPNIEDSLRPGETVTRAELAAALYTYELNSSMR